MRFLYGNSSLEGINFKQNAVLEPYDNEGKGLSADEFYRLVLKSIISQRLVGFTRQKKERKTHAACLLVICCLTRVINGKIIEDEASHNFWRFLDEDFFLPVIKPPRTYFNNKLFLLAYLRSSVLLSPPPAFFCVLHWIQFVLIEIQRVRDGKVFLFFLDKHCIESCEQPLHFLLNSFPNRFLQQQLEYIYASLQLSGKIPTMNDRI